MPGDAEWFQLQKRTGRIGCATQRLGYPPGFLRKCVITKGVKVLYFDTLLQVFILNGLRSTDGTEIVNTCRQRSKATLLSKTLGFTVTGKSAKCMFLEAGWWTRHTSEQEEVYRLFMVLSRCFIVIRTGFLLSAVGGWSWAAFWYASKARYWLVGLSDSGFWAFDAFV